MTKKLMLGIFLASFLLLTNLALAGERSSPGPAIAKIGAVPSDCDCLKKDKAPTSPGLKADVLIEKPDRINMQPGDCGYEWVCVRYCNFWPSCGPVYYGHCLEWRWMYVCRGGAFPHWQ